MNIVSKGIFAAAIALVGATAAEAQVNCCPTGRIDTFVNNDVIANGCTCRIGPSGDVNGAILQIGDGSVIVLGRVNDVDESGLGDVIVGAGGWVKGSVSEVDAGSLVVRSGGSLEGNAVRDGRWRGQRHRRSWRRVQGRHRGVGARRCRGDNRVRQLRGIGRGARLRRRRRHRSAEDFVQGRRQRVRRRRRERWSSTAPSKAMRSRGAAAI